MNILTNLTKTSLVRENNLIYVAIIYYQLSLFTAELDLLHVHFRVKNVPAHFRSQLFAALKKILGN